MEKQVCSSEKVDFKNMSQHSKVVGVNYTLMVRSGG